MSRLAEFHPEALQEFSAAAARYTRIRPSLGEAFIDRVAAATAAAVSAPLTGSPIGSEIRRVFVRRFPYYLIYATVESRVFILAVAHVRRRPGYWRERR